MTRQSSPTTIATPHFARYLTPLERGRLDRLLALNQKPPSQITNLDVQAANLDFRSWLEEATPIWHWSWAYQLHIQAHIRKVLNGTLDRLILSVPPRHGKSEMVTVRLPAFVLDFAPDFRWIIGAYSQTLADKFSRKVRRLAQERGVKIDNSSRKVDDWETLAGGGLRAAGVGAGVTGMGANGGLIDDPVKNRAEANSETYRNKTWDWYNDDFLTRLEPGGFVIVTMTRWHIDDLAGRLLREQGRLEEGGEWVEINLPALADPGDPLGRRPGEALCPDRYNEAALARIKAALKGSFDALFMGRPTAQEGNLLKRQWIRRYRTRPAPSATLQIVQSWDTASKASEVSAFSVCSTWAITRLGVYLLDVFRDRLEYPDLRRAAIREAEKWQPSAILIEDKSTGQSLIQELRSETLLPIVPIEPEGDKVTRFSVETAAYESGQVFHPEDAPWLADLEGELVSFPLAPEADQADSISQFLRWARRRFWVWAWDSVPRAEGSASEKGIIDDSTGWGRVTGGHSSMRGF